jgi:surface antigen
VQRRDGDETEETMTAMMDWVREGATASVVRAGAGLLCASLAAGCTTLGQGTTPVGQFASSAVRPAVSTQPVVRDGGILRASVRSRLSTASAQEAAAAEYRALERSPAGEPLNWASADKTVRGEIVTGQPYQVGSQNCRAYTHTIFVTGVPETARGSACRTPDGNWTPLT